jgi:hypothetical protein
MRSTSRPSETPVAPLEGFENARGPELQHLLELRDAQKRRSSNEQTNKASDTAEAVAALAGQILVSCEVNSKLRVAKGRAK